MWSGKLLGKVWAVETKSFGEKISVKNPYILLLLLSFRSGSCSRARANGELRPRWKQVRLFINDLSLQVECRSAEPRACFYFSTEPDRLINAVQSKLMKPLRWFAWSLRVDSTSFLSEIPATLNSMIFDGLDYLNSNCFLCLSATGTAFRWAWFTINGGLISWTKSGKFLQLVWNEWTCSLK